MEQLFASDVVLIGAALAGLALTCLGIVHDLGAKAPLPHPV